MNKFLKTVRLSLTLIVLVVAIGVIYLFIAFPKVETPSSRIVEATPERIARGEYLANHVTVCMDCHATHDWRFFSAPPVHGTEGMGGDRYGEEMGIPGSIYPGNLTPAGLGDWSDGEIMRAITSGINKDGEALFPFMPYTEYRHLSEEDLLSIVSYLRSLSPIENAIPKRRLSFPMNLIVRTIPEPAQPKPHPDPTDTMAYGKYLATISGCKFCHTPQEQGVPITGMEFAGGFEFSLPTGRVRTMNITPDSETGIGGWDEVTFINIFKAYNPDDVRLDTLGVDEVNTVMPWSMYSGMREEDLSAIYDYLRSVPAIKNRIDRFIPHQLNDDKNDK